MKKIAIQGVPGSYHDIAAHKYFKDEEIELICCNTFEEVFENMRKDSNVIGTVAIENTIAGSLLTCTDDAVYYKYETGYTGTYEEAKEITLSMICYSPIDEYYFPDHGFRQYVKDSFDKDNDGIMTFDELMEVERISLPDDNNTYNIYNLKGVEYFKNLKYLTCTETSLQSLDVSKNPLLEDLALNENELTTLKVSGLSKLLNLYCENNRLTSLDVSGCTALRTIRCGYNAFDSLNVKGC